MKTTKTLLEATFKTGYLGMSGASDSFNLLVKELDENEVYELQTKLSEYDSTLYIKIFKPKKNLKGGYNPYIFSIQSKMEISVDDEYEPVVEDILLYYFKLNVFRFLIAANIAYPGSLAPYSFEIWSSNSRKWTFNERFGDLASLSMEFDKDTKWGLLETIKLIDVWKWLTSTPGFYEDIANTQLNKVITLLEYIFLDPREVGYETLMDGFVADVVWVTVALEILYLSDVDRDQSKTRELTNRIKSFLNPKSGGLLISDKDIKNIYDYRSRFMHGDLEIINLFHSWEDEKFPIYYDHLRGNLDKALIILVATLQKLCKLRWNALNFEVKYKPVE